MMTNNDEAVWKICSLQHATTADDDDGDVHNDGNDNDGKENNSDDDDNVWQSFPFNDNPLFLFIRGCFVINNTITKM